MKLREYANTQGVSYLTALKWFHAGRITGAYQMPTGTIIVPDVRADDPAKPARTVVYARVSIVNRRHSDLEAQAQRLEQFCSANGWAVHRVIKEVGAGLDDNRSKLWSIIDDDAATRVVVDYKDRLTLFGFHYVERIFKLRGVELVVFNEVTDDKKDLLDYLLSVITSFYTCIYGQRRGKRMSEKPTAELENAAG